jgi:type IV secretion system protein VirB4
VNAFLTEQMHRPCPALAVLTTIFGIPYHFNFHVKDLGHTFVVGPSRSGKTVFMLFLIAQFRKYYGARIYIFDKDQSCRIATLLMGGQHIDLDFEARALRLNPLLLLAEPKLHGRIKDWLAGLLAVRGYELEEEDHQCLIEAVRGTYGMGASMWRLRYLYTLLSPRPRLQTLLKPWVHDGEFAHIYDNAEDSFSLSDFTCMELGRILAVKEIARTFTDYAFLRIDLELARISEHDEEGELIPRVPTLIYFEEGWYFLEDPVYRERFRTYAKTLAKKLGILATSTQSLEDIAESPIFPSIRDNFATKIFLPNRNVTSPALRQLYQQQFLLNDAQIEALACATQKKQYLIGQGGLTRLISVDLDPESLASQRSDSEAQAVFDRHYGSGRAGWREAYLREMTGHG